MRIVSDIDECAEGVHKCHGKAECMNNDGSFLCSCKSGYIGNGMHCEGMFYKRYSSLLQALIPIQCLQIIF